MLTERRLKRVSTRLVRLREELRITDEQLLQLTEEADDTRLRSLVSETPLAEHEHREAARAEAAMQRHRSDLVTQLDALEREQDDLLDRLRERRPD